MQGRAAFDSAISFLPQSLCETLASVDGGLKSRVYEIRLRSARPVMLVAEDGTFFVYRSGRTGKVYSPGAVTADTRELADCFSRMCGYSVHANITCAANGFLSLAHGHRAGVYGTAVLDDAGAVKSFRDISGINLRIAREKPGVSDALCAELFGQGLISAVIAGPPLSGKTTLLRDIVRRLSGPDGGRYYRVAVVDERGEIAASSGGSPQCDVGFADVLTDYPKDIGIITALRTLSPQMIVCDEVGTSLQAERISEGLNSGVDFLLSVHADQNGCEMRPAVKRLLSCGAFSKLVLLGGRPGEIAGIYDIKGRNYADGGSGACGIDAVFRGELCGSQACKADSASRRGVHDDNACAHTA